MSHVVSSLQLHTVDKTVFFLKSAVKCIIKHPAPFDYQGLLMKQNNLQETIFKSGSTNQIFIFSSSIVQKLSVILQSGNKSFRELQENHMQS